MKAVLASATVALALAGVVGHATAQQRQNVSSYLQQGYQIINSTLGGGNLMLIMKKDAVVVMCAVSIDTGQTAACQTVK
jgi:hypothetical protein